MSLLASKKVIAYSLLIVGVLVFAWYVFIRVVPGEAIKEIRFISDTPEAAITVVFNQDTAVLSGLRFESVTLNEAETSSGRRFEDRASGLTFWYEGGVGTLYERGAIIFTGTDAAQIPAAVPPPENLLANQLVATSWQWQETIMSDGTRVKPSRAEDFSITFAYGSVVGTTDCNNFSGTYELTGAALAMGPFRMTKMYCADSKEQSFVDVLQGETTVLFNLEGNLVLLLKDDAGSVFFTRASTSPTQ